MKINHTQHVRYVQRADLPVGLKGRGFQKSESYFFPVIKVARFAIVLSSDILLLPLETDKYFSFLNMADLFGKTICSHFCLLVRTKIKE